jgi:hypothetical protein
MLRWSLQRLKNSSQMESDSIRGNWDEGESGWWEVFAVSLGYDGGEKENSFVRRQLL